MDWTEERKKHLLREAVSTQIQLTEQWLETAKKMEEAYPQNMHITATRTCFAEDLIDLVKLSLELEED